MVKMKFAGLALALGFLALFTLAPAASQAALAAAPTTNAVTVPVTGTTTGGNTFAGVYSLTRFVNQNGTLSAVGTLSGTLTNTLGQTIGSVTNVPVQVPVLSGAGSSCSILDLTLGPLHLNLLGLVVDLNQVHLTITAQQGSGNLLGNLLCAVANALNGGVPLGALSGLLNNVLRNL